MKKLLRVLFYMFLINSITFCSSITRSPHISFENASDNYIYKPTGTWNGYRLAGGQLEMFPALSGSEIFTFQHHSDLFGAIHIEWQNARKEKIVKEFMFKKDLLPGFSQKYQNDWIFFYLGQTESDFKMFVSPRGMKSKEHLEYIKSLAQIDRDFIALCYPISGWGNQPKGDNRPSASTSACKSLMPIYQPSNMPKINKARKEYEEQEKQRLQNIRDYQERKAKQ